MKEKIFLLLCLLSIPFSMLKAQSLWSSADMKYQLTKGLTAFVEGEYRTYDGMSSTERWATSVGMDYKIMDYLKINGGYTFIDQRSQEKITKKGNIIPPYWLPKNRGFFSITGSKDWNRFTFSLRERYQFTHSKDKYVLKYDDDGITRKDDELINSIHKHVIRSRIEIEYNIRKSNFTPYTSCEFYNDPSSEFHLDKIRWTLGTQYKINKKHSVDVFYRYINKSDNDEENGHIIGIGYTFKISRR